MLVKIIIYIIGILLISFGFSTLILYINLLSFGYTFKEYLCYVLSKFETYYILIGFLLINITYLIKGAKKW